MSLLLQKLKKRYLIDEILYFCLHTVFALITFFFVNSKNFLLISKNVFKMVLYITDNTFELCASFLDMPYTVLKKCFDKQSLTIKTEASCETKSEIFLGLYRSSCILYK